MSELRLFLFIFLIFINALAADDPNIKRQVDLEGTEAGIPEKFCEACKDKYQEKQFRDLVRQAGDLKFILKQDKTPASQVVDEANSKDPVTLNLKSSSAAIDIKGALKFEAGGGKFGVRVGRRSVKVNYEKNW